MAAIEKSVFATLPPEQFIAYLENHGITPTPSERQPLFKDKVELYVGVEQVVNQTDGWPVGETSAK